MRQIFFLVLLFITTGLFAQAPSNYTNINGRYRWIAGMFDSTFHIPKGTTTSLRTGGSTNAGALFYRTTDSSVYYYTGTQWLKVAGAAGFVPYTGATQNVNLGQFGLTTKFVQFDTSSQAVTDRRLQWSNAEGTLQFGMTNGATITQRIGLEQFARVRNLQGDTIEAGDVVYISGASGDRAAVKLADNRADSTSSKTLGVATEQILPNDVGLVGTFGVVGKLNLSAFTAGDVVYLDSIPGKLTKVKPQAPYHMVFVGVVERANAGNGLLFVNVQNGYELEELHNVRITSPVRNNAILAYDSVGRLWKDTTLNALGGITGSGTSGQVSYFNGTNSITSSPTFAFTPTSQLLVNNSVTAAGAIARGINATPTLTAAANNDVLVGLDIAPTFTNGAFTGVQNDAIRITGLSRLNGNVILGGANDRYIHYNTTSTILAGRDGSAVYFGYNFGSQLIDIGSLGSGNIRFRTSGNTIVESGKLLVGTSTDAGFRLDVNGTARVQGATTITGNVSVVTNAGTSQVTIGDGSTSPNSTLRIAKSATSNAANIFFRNVSTDVARIWLDNSDNLTLTNGSNLIVGTTGLQVSGSITAASAIARGVNFTNTLVAAANNDVLVGLDINPTFTNGAFTGVTNTLLRLRGTNPSTNMLDVSVSGTGPGVIAQFGGSISAGNNQLRVYTSTTGVILGADASQSWIASAANDLRINTNSFTERIRIFNSTGNVGINVSGTDAGFRLDVNGTARVQTQFTVGTYMGNGGTINAAIGFFGAYSSSNNNVDQFLSQFTLNSGNTSNVTSFRSNISTPASAFTLTNLKHFEAQFSTLGAGSAITNHYGILVNSNLSNANATNTYGFYGDIASGTGRWNLYINGTAQNYFGGNVMIGTTTAGGRFTIQPTNDQVGMAISGSSLTGSNAQSLVSLSQTWNTTGNPTAFLLNITNTASGATADLMELQVGGVSQFTVGKSGTIQTTAPAGGTAKPWKLGNVAVVSPTSPDRTIEVEIDGVTYYIHAKTTNN